MKKSTSMFSVAFAVSWCCVLPAGLAIFGLAGTAATKIIFMKYMPFMLGLSVVFRGRANAELIWNSITKKKTNRQENNFPRIIFDWKFIGKSLQLVPVKVPKHLHPTGELLQ